MLKIQVSHSYYLQYDRKQWERGKPYPPLATIQVAAFLRQHGHEVTLFDTMLADGVEAYAASLHAAAPTLVPLSRDADEDVREIALLCLAETGGAGAVRAMLARLKMA